MDVRKVAEVLRRMMTLDLERFGVVKKVSASSLKVVVKVDVLFKREVTADIPEVIEVWR